MLKRRYAPYQNASSKTAPESAKRGSPRTSAIPEDTGPSSPSIVENISNAERTENSQKRVNQPRATSPIHAGDTDGQARSVSEHEAEKIGSEDNWRRRSHPSWRPENDEATSALSTGGMRNETTVASNDTPISSNESYGNVFSLANPGDFQLLGSADNCSSLLSGGFPLDGHPGRPDTMLPELGTESAHQTAFFVKRYSGTIGTWYV